MPALVRVRIESALVGLAAERDGRCGAYEDRPENCRNFEASTTKTPTCVFYKVKSIGGV